MSSRDYTRHTVTTAVPPAARIGDEYFNPSTNALYKVLAINGTTTLSNQVAVLSSTGALTIASNTASASTATGALVVAGGVGVSGDIYTGGNAYMSSANVGATSNSPRLGWTDNYFYRNNLYNGLYYQGNFLSFNSTLVYIDTTSTLHIRGSIANDYGNQQVLIGSTSQLSVANTLASTSTTTGALLVSGGVGIAGALYVGGVTQTAAITSNGTIIASTVNAGTIGNTGATLTGTLNTAAQPSVTTMTGLTGFGTVGVTTTAAGNLTVTGNLTVNGTQNIISSTTYETTEYVVTQNATYGNVTNSLYAGSINTANAVITGGYVQGLANIQTTGTIIASTINAGTFGNATATHVGASATLTGTLIATTVNAGTIGNSGATLTGTLSTAAQTNITSVSTLTGLTVSGAIVPNANSTVNLGGTTTYWNNLYATAITTNGITVGASGGIMPAANVVVNIGSASTWFNTFYGVSTQAKYADLAENYQADKAYNPATVLMFGGAFEVTLATADTTAVAGVVSTNPAHLMNGQLSGSNVVPLALMGRVPCMVIGPVHKGDMMVAAGFGYAKSSTNPTIGQVIGKALEDFPINAKGVIEVVVGRM